MKEQPVATRKSECETHPSISLACFSVDTVAIEALRRSKAKTRSLSVDLSADQRWIEHLIGDIVS